LIAFFRPADIAVFPFDLDVRQGDDRPRINLIQGYRPGSLVLIWGLAIFGVTAKAAGVIRRPYLSTGLCLVWLGLAMGWLFLAGHYAAVVLDARNRAPPPLGGRYRLYRRYSVFLRLSGCATPISYGAYLLPRVLPVIILQCCGTLERLYSGHSRLNVLRDQRVARERIIGQWS
jgi:hypothetical protein